MQKLTDKQKKAGWIVLAILYMGHFAPNFIAVVRQPFSHTRPAPTVQAHYVPPVATVSPITPVTKTAVTPDPAALELLGRFSGQQLQSDMETCRVSLEVKPKALETGFYSAYESRSCVPSFLFSHGPLTAQKLLEARNAAELALPVSTSMSGSMNDGAMTFRIDQVVGATEHHCGPRTYSISPFGTGQIMAQWEEPAPCNSKNGHMVLAKAR